MEPLMYNFLSNFSKKAEITGKEWVWHVHKPVEIGYYTIFRIEDIKKYQHFVEKASVIFFESIVAFLLTKYLKNCI